MPTGPKARSAPPCSLKTIRVAQIAIGEAEEEYVEKPEKDEAAAALGRKAARDVQNS
jgi:hypothetical protein